MKKAALKQLTAQKANDSRREKVINQDSEKGKANFSVSGRTQSG